MSELSVPIIVEGKVVGVINLESVVVNAYTIQDKELVEILALHVASALERIRRSKELTEIMTTEFSRIIDVYNRGGSQIRHDLRTPLMNIKNAVTLLRMNPPDDEMYDVLECSVNYMDKILEDWRQHTVSDTVVTRQTDLSELIHEAINLVAVPEKTSIIVEVPTDVDFEIDHNKILRVLVNLIKNSVESISGDGSISITVNVDDSGLVIDVKDTGSGIPENVIGRLFTPFFSTKMNGMGLGLAYCKQAVEGHGGNIIVETETGKGTKFTIKIPKK